jgi:hypothetical protein
MLEVHDVLSRFIDDLLARPTGPFSFRFLLQPLMAAALALRDGVKDARAGRVPYFWGMLRDAGHRRERLVEGLKRTARVIALGLVLDAAYQFVVLHYFYLDEALVMALALGFVPYLLVRGPADRIARRWAAHKAPHQEAS